MTKKLEEIADEAADDVRAAIMGINVERMVIDAYQKMLVADIKEEALFLTTTMDDGVPCIELVYDHETDADRFKTPLREVLYWVINYSPDGTTYDEESIPAMEIWAAELEACASDVRAAIEKVKAG